MYVNYGPIALLIPEGGIPHSAFLLNICSMLVKSFPALGGACVRGVS